MPRRGGRTEWKAIPAIGVFAVITLAFMAGKSRGAASLLNDPAYWPVFSLHVYFQNMSHYLNLLFYSGNFFRAGRTTGFLAGGLVMAAFLRARTMAFGWLWFLIGMLPVAFIPVRGGSVLYIPSLGFAVAAVDLLRAVFDAVESSLRGSAQRFLNPESTPVFVLALVCITSVQWHFKRSADAAAKRLSAQYQSFAADLKREGGHGSSLLYLTDPFGLDRYDPEFIASLVRGEPDLRVGRARSNQGLLSPAAAAIYDDVLDFENGHLHRVAKSELPFVLDRLRAQSGYADPVSGLSVATDGWWRAKGDFAVAVRCPVAQNHCEVGFDLGTVQGTRKVSVDVNGVHWRDLFLSAVSPRPAVLVSLQGSERTTPIRFTIDRAVPTPDSSGQDQGMAIILSGTHIR